jgi:cytochrome o ubiquinol oxidase operon protein cyoD
MSKVSSTKSAVTKYVIGFTLSLVFTLAAFWLVIQHVDNNHQGGPSHEFILISIISLAIAQLIVQLYFFLHLGHESKPRWNLIVALFMVMVLVIVVFGSLWIMDNLDYHMMGTEETKEYLHDHPGAF